MWIFQAILCFQTVFLTVQTLTPLFYPTVQNFVVFFRLLDSKFNEDSKNVPKTVIFLFQVDFSGNFVLTVLSNYVSDSSNFAIPFLPDCTKFCRVFSGYWIGNLMRFQKFA